MKIWIILAFLMSLAACGSTEKNTSAGQIPASMQCPADQNSGQGCPSPLSAGLSADGGQSGPTSANNKAEAASRMKSHTQIIEGRCELWVKGDDKPRFCSEVKVMIRSTEKGEMRDAAVNGFAITFADLNEKSYKLLAQSENYFVTVPGAILKPGKKVDLKLKAKLRKP